MSIPLACEHDIVEYTCVRCVKKKADELQALKSDLVVAVKALEKIVKVIEYDRYPVITSILNISQEALAILSKGAS